MLVHTIVLCTTFFYKSLENTFEIGVEFDLNMDEIKDLYQV